MLIYVKFFYLGYVWSRKVSGKEKKMVRKIIFSYLVLLWKIWKKVKYN